MLNRNFPNFLMLFYPISKELKLSELEADVCRSQSDTRAMAKLFKHFVSNFLYYILFSCFHRTYDLATLFHNPTQLPRHYRRMSLYLSLLKTPPNIFLPISARTEFLSGKAYTNVTTVPSQICPSSNLEQL